MSKQRMVNTKFWSDSWIVNLDPLERYLYLYLLTNEHTNIAGVYELPIRVMAFETGLDKEMLPKMLGRFSEKVLFKDGWVAIKNFQKHQSTSSSKVRKGIEVEMAKVPQNIREYIENGYPIHTLSNPIIYSNTNSNPNTNSNTKKKSFHGEFKNVLLTDDEYTKLVEALNENAVLGLIAELDTYIESSGKKYKSHYATLQNWARRRVNDYAKERLNAKPKMI